MRTTSSRSLSLRQKNIISLSLFIVPFLVILGMLIRTSQTNINFAKLELVGDVFQRQATPLLTDLVRLKIAVLKNDSNQISQLSTDVKNKYASYASTYKSLAGDLQLTPEGLSARKRDAFSITKTDDKMNALSAMTDLGSEKSLALINDMIQDIRGIITHSGDTSNIILDPDLDSYYLGDVTLGAIPQVLDRLQESFELTSQIFKKGSLGPQERIALAGFVALFHKADLERIQGDLDTSINEDPNFYGVLASLKPALTDVSASSTEHINKYIDSLEALSHSNNPQDLKEKVTTAAAGLGDSIGDNWLKSAQELDELLQTRISSLENTRNWSLALGILVMLISSLISIYISEKLIRAPIEKVAGSVHEMSAEIKNACTQVKEMAEKISNNSTSNAAALEETVASIEELNSTAKLGAENSVTAADMSDKTFQSAKKGEEQISQLIESMTQITQSASKVQEILSVIDDIAFQTNLLALNAAVEAARAGEQGKGFAVVAEAVRNLAQRSAVAAKEIAQLIQTSTEVTHAGAKIADGNSRTFTEIVQSIGKVNSLSSEVAKASTEQTTGITQINKALTQIDTNTQSFAAMSEELSASNVELQHQALRLNDMVASLSKVIYG